MIWIFQELLWEEEEEELQYVISQLKWQDHFVGAWSFSRASPASSLLPWGLTLDYRWQLAIEIQNIKIELKQWEAWWKKWGLSAASYLDHTWIYLYILLKFYFLHLVLTWLPHVRSPFSVMGILRSTSMDVSSPFSRSSFSLDTARSPRWGMAQLPPTSQSQN